MSGSGVPGDDDEMVLKRVIASLAGSGIYACLSPCRSMVYVCAGSSLRPRGDWYVLKVWAAGPDEVHAAERLRELTQDWDENLGRWRRREPLYLT